MRGYFGIGAAGISKEHNLGALVRTAHAFGADFFFTIAPVLNEYAIGASDTADSFEHMPHYRFKTTADLVLPEDCVLVGVELTDEAVELPSFRHPARAAYIFGPEMGHLSPEAQSRCAHIVKIPLSFCVNVGIAGAITMYDRMICMGRFAERPVKPGGPLLEDNLPKSKGGLRRRKSRKKG